jgi:cytochrome c
MRHYLKEQIMKNVARVCAVIAAVLVVWASSPLAQQHATKEDAVALLGKAVAYAKANGPEKAFAAFSDPNGGFIKGELYVVCLDKSATMKAHVNPKMVGQNFANLVDSDGFNFTKAMIEKSAGGHSGSVDYKFSNPVSKKIENKTTFFEGVGDLTIGVGIYR